MSAALVHPVIVKVRVYAAAKKLVNASVIVNSLVLESYVSV